MRQSLLLDTRAHLWAVSALQRLSDRAREAVSRPETVLLVSAASAWEMAIKHRAGRWPEAEVLLRTHDDLLDRLGPPWSPGTQRSPDCPACRGCGERAPRPASERTRMLQSQLGPRSQAPG